MKIFNSQAEVDAALNSDGNLVVADDVQFKTDVRLDGNIVAWKIVAGNIDAGNIDARNIDAGNINAGNIVAGNIDAWNIDAWDIDARDIDAENIVAENIVAWDINARDIDAGNIDYYAACLAYESFRCRSVKGRRDNALHACLDQEIEYVAEKKEKIMKRIIETTEKSGFEELLGERVVIFSLNYIYTGKVIGVNDTCVLLDEAQIVYETGVMTEPGFKDAQPLPTPLWYVSLSAVESFGRAL